MAWAPPFRGRVGSGPGDPHRTAGDGLFVEAPRDNARGAGEDDVVPPIAGPPRVGKPFVEWGSAAEPGVRTEANFHTYERADGRWVIAEEIGSFVPGL